jgi:hypothetical protein
LAIASDVPIAAAGVAGLELADPAAIADFVLQHARAR